MIRGRNQELTGYTSRELKNISWDDDIIHPEDREAVGSHIQAAAEANGSFELIYRIITKSGEEKWVSEKGHITPSVDSVEPKLKGFISDITDQKRMEEALREAKERYESLFNSIRDAILVADMERRIINCNPALTDLFGYELEEIEGKHTKYVYASDEDYEEMGEAIAGHIGDPTFTHTVKYEKKSGQTFPGETNVFYLRDAADDIVGFIGVIKDVSDERDRLLQLQVLDRILQHNFHNDMNVIQGNVNLIEEEGTAPLTTYAERIRETGNALLDTVEKEREITNFLSDPPPPEERDIIEVCSRVVDRISTRFPDAEISTRYTGEAVVETTIVIERAIEELLTNSIVHSEQDEPQVTLVMSADEAEVTVQVIDENPHIPEMEQTVITGEEELSPLYHGSGMGLWFVSLVVNHSDGMLEFDNNEPRGNRVQIRLPAA